MRIAGVYPQPIELDLGLDPDPDEPLGIGYVLAAAQQAGHDVKLLVPVDGDFTALQRRLMAFRPDVVAVSMLTMHVERARLLARWCRKWVEPKLLVAGGSHPTAAPFDLLGDFDVCVIGEGEETFVALIELANERDLWSSIDGIAYRSKEGNPVLNPRRPRITSLDDLPPPLRDARFHSSTALGISYPLMTNGGFASVLYSRGCPFTCQFCNSPQHWGRQVTFRSPLNMVDELRTLRDQFGVRFVSFADLTFTVNRKRTVELCEALLREDLGVHWMCETTLNTVDEELLTLMAAAGCTKICWGVETTDAESLSIIKKPITIPQMNEVLQWSEKRGILNWAFTMIGFPWQHENGIEVAGARLPELAIHQLRVSIATPFPGTTWATSYPPLLRVPSLHFDTSHLTFRHPTISAGQMTRLRLQTLRRFYTATSYRERMAKMARSFPQLQESIAQFLFNVDQWLQREHRDCPRSVGR